MLAMAVEPSAELKSEEPLEPSAELKLEEPLEPSAELKSEEPLEPSAELKSEEPLEPSAELKSEEPLEPSAELKSEELLEPSAELKLSNFQLGEPMAALDLLATLAVQSTASKLSIMKQENIFILKSDVHLTQMPVEYIRDMLVIINRSWKVRLVHY